LTVATSFSLTPALSAGQSPAIGICCAKLAVFTCRAHTAAAIDVRFATVPLTIAAARFGTPSSRTRATATLGVRGAVLAEAARIAATAAIDVRLAFTQHAIEALTWRVVDAFDFRSRTAYDQCGYHE
jgi:hypothetical protein